MRSTGASYPCPAQGTLLDGCHDLIVCTCFLVACAAPACSDLSDLSNFYCICGMYVGHVSHEMYLSCLCMPMSHELSVLILMQSSHIQLLQKLRKHKHDLFWLCSSNFDPWHRRLCDWLHAHLAQLSDPRSSRGDSAHAVYWVRLHPHCFLHPLHFGAATLMWVKVMWLSIVEYLTVDMSLGDTQTAPRLLSSDPCLMLSKHSDGGTNVLSPSLSAANFVKNGMYFRHKCLWQTLSTF